MHAGEPLSPHDLLRAWTFEPGVVLSVAVGAALYGAGLRRLWRAAGIGRGIARWQALSFALGLATILVALISPLDALGDALFSAHMTQHLLLILIAPPLLLWANPVVALLWALPRARRARLLRWWRASSLRHAWEAITHPAAAWTLHAATLVAWHIPPVFDAALRHDAVHALEHATFLGTALLFWWPVLHPAGRRRLGYGGAILYLFAISVLGGAVGALLTFAPVVVYAYGPATRVWGLSPLQDQQLAGLIMWIPGGTVYVIAIAGVVLRWFAVDGRFALFQGDVAPAYAPALRRTPGN